MMMTEELWNLVRNVPQVAGGIGSMVGGVAGVIALLQIRLFRKQMSHDHERSRRVHAIADLAHWNAHLNETVTSARRLVETFGPEQLECLRVGRGLKIPVRQRAIATVALAASMPALVEPEMLDPLFQDGEGIVLSAEHVIRLRNRCIEHLNACEITLLGWRHGTADKQIVEEQMNYLVDLNHDWRMLENFRREVVNDGAYPSIEQFVTEVYQRKKSVQDKARLIVTSLIRQPRAPLGSD